MYKYFLWLLKIGTPINLYFLWRTLIPPLSLVDIRLLLPAQIFFAVSAYRCFFPVSYTTNSVLHNTFVSSVFITRLLATFVEVAYIYMFSFIIRTLNDGQIPFIDLLSWLMVSQVIISQFFVWGAIVVNKQLLYYFEEIGWGVIFLINTILSIFLFYELDFINKHKILLQLNIAFGIIYLPWQWIHLKSIWERVKEEKFNKKNHKPITWIIIIEGLSKSINIKNKNTEPKSWGGIIGLTWMFGYWASLISAWIFLIIQSV